MTFGEIIGRLADATIITMFILAIVAALRTKNGGVMMAAAFFMIWAAFLFAIRS